MSSPRKLNDNRIPGIVLMGTPMDKAYKTTGLKTKALGNLLRGLYAAFLRRGNAQNGPGRP